MTFYHQNHDFWIKIDQSISFNENSLGVCCPVVGYPRTVNIIYIYIHKPIEYRKFVIIIKIYDICIRIKPTGSPEVREQENIRNQALSHQKCSGELLHNWHRVTMATRVAMQVTGVPIAPLILYSRIM